MASKKTKTKNQFKPKEINSAANATRTMRIIFLVLSILVVLSMVLAAMASFY